MTLEADFQKDKRLSNPAKQTSFRASNCDRRQFLWQLAVGSAALATAPMLTACGLFDDAELRVGSLADLAARGFLEADFNDGRVFVRPADAHTEVAKLTAADVTQGALVALELTCTHKGCIVAWQPRTQEFVCPCHQGRYDPEGRVLAGKPPAPLSRWQVELRGDEIWVLKQTPQRTPA
jgi:nitrite reductase/ring-hydroxylating ferredoxin subunit